MSRKYYLKRSSVLIALVFFLIYSCKDNPSNTYNQDKTGSLEVEITTLGEDIDPDGYSLSLGGINTQNVEVNETILLNEVKTGSYNLELSGLQGNCTVSGGNPKRVTIVEDETTTEVLSINCKYRIKNKIVFASNRNGSGTGIYSMNPDGSSVTELTDPTDAQDAIPVVSPNGTRIAFIRGPGAAMQEYQTYVMDADGSNVMALTNKSGGAFYPSWSPDGTRILFTSYGDNLFDIFIFSIDDSEVVQLTNSSETDQYAKWSPNGEQIAFMSSRDGDPEICLINPDGEGFVNLTDNSVVDLDPEWSPDGEKIVFMSDSGGYSNLYTMNSDGSGKQKITNNTTTEDSYRYPSWSPDGEEVAFVIFRDGMFEIFKVAADGSSQIESLAYTPGFDNYFPSWSPIQ